MSSPVSQLETLQKNSEFVFLVCTGHWCPFCLNYIKSLASIGPSIKAAGGQPIIITAKESPELVKIVREKTGYTDAAIVDPKHEIANSLRARGLLDLTITEKKGYSQGMVQPGALVLGKEGEVMYAWASRPSLSNLGGAKDRPLLEQVWGDVEAVMQGRERVHGGVYGKQTFLQGIGMKLFG
ncbi:hypothetical protein M409DRAFT_29238 [Zasmidium cellare ATCC 36951]|uniref:Alkyl hydroperoxide reductase subunit C/ Thiol specific antioxidant domain-containing protein n=1 Tax=Zasmidium cellare ATCC 36951 TaxID=1080233 RepID=A0A6A6C3E2_ZASCE|nr:uncharacterized protein M409DRAFT_29238 [Zasmidium cellare ATCC 36951]KAF2160392.1 hypothetical protein M409DRAFT_29238 [Zasmidium cellare ATCC 36951]